jgi:hypothetical protein
MANDRWNQDDEPMSDDVVGKAAGEDEEFEDLEDSDEEDRDEDADIDEE